MVEAACCVVRVFVRTGHQAATGGSAPCSRLNQFNIVLDTDAFVNTPRVVGVVEDTRILFLP